MRIPAPLALLIATSLTMPIVGCGGNENTRLAEMAENQLARQAEQNRQMAELQQEVATGARQLVEADAQARHETIAIQRELQGARSDVDRQRDALEAERREISSQRQRDPIVAEAIMTTGLLLACLLPLVLCWYLLRRPAEPADDQTVVEILLEDLVADRPLLLVRDEEPSAIAAPEDRIAKHLTDDSDDTAAESVP